MGKNFYRAVFLLLVLANGFFLYRLKQFSDALQFVNNVVMVNVAGNSYFAGCLNDRVGDPRNYKREQIEPHVKICDERTAAYLETLKKVAGIR